MISKRHLIQGGVAALAFAASGLALAQSVSSSDKSWMEKAARAGTAEVLAGNLATTNAKDPQIKDFGKQMAADHGKANDALKAIASKKGVTLPDTPDSAHQKEQAKLEKLTDDKFDKEYIKNAGVKDHKDAVALFKKGAKDLKDPDLKAFAQNTLPTVQHHQQMANDLAKNK